MKRSTEDALFSVAVLIGLLVALLIFAMCAGCAAIPVERTYSLGASDGKRTLDLGVTLRPPARPAP